MPSPLDRLAAPGGPLKREPPDRTEFNGLMGSGRARLNDVAGAALSSEGRFDLLYNAAHALCLAALRYRGFRPVNRYIVFQVLPHTLGLGQEVSRVLAKAHDARNLAEYRGEYAADERLLADILAACKTIVAKLEILPPLP